MRVDRPYPVILPPPELKREQLPGQFLQFPNKSVDGLA